MDAATDDTNTNAKGSRGLSPVMRESRDEDEKSISDWINSLAGDAAVKVSIVRKSPLLGPNGENISGSLETVDERIDEDYVRETWGGGTFQLIVQKPNDNGNGGYKYFKARTIKIAGDAKMHGRALSASGHTQQQHAAPAEDPLAERAFDAMQKNVEYERSRARELEQQRGQQNGGIDFAAVQAMNAPLYDQLRMAQQTISDLQARVIESVGRPTPQDPFRDRMMERMLDGESARIEALRTQFASEMRMSVEHHREEIKILRAQHADEVKAQERRHEREIDMFQRSTDMQVKSSDVAHGSRTDGLKAENDRLNRELTESRARIGALELRKDQSITDKADELIKIKEALGGLGGDDKEEAWYEKLIGAVGNSEAAIKFLSKMTGEGGAAAGGELPPVGQPFQGPDGQVYVRNPDNSVVLANQAAQHQQQQQMMQQQRLQLIALKKRKAAAAAARARAAAVPMGPATEGAAADGGVVDEALADAAAGTEIEEAAPVAPPVRMRKPDASDVSMAVRFMEGAINNNTPPEKFGVTARSMIPGDILAYIGHVGVDEFLNKVAKLESGSPLTTIKGRQFARQVAKFLLEGTTEGA